MNYGYHLDENYIAIFMMDEGSVGLAEDGKAYWRVSVGKVNVGLAKGVSVLDVGENKLVYVDSETRVRVVPAKMLLG